MSDKHWLVYWKSPPSDDEQCFQVTTDYAANVYRVEGYKVEGPFVPVPDETVIERGAKATWDYDEEVFRSYVEKIPLNARAPEFAHGYTPRPWEDAEPEEREEYLERFRAGLRAALGDGDGS